MKYADLTALINYAPPKNSVFSGNVGDEKSPHSGGRKKNCFLSI